jgi:hypothetical protein
MNIRATSLAATVGIVGLLGVLAGCGESASSDPEPQASASPSLPPAGEVILQDPFDDDTNGWGVIHHPEFGDADYENGTYVWRTTGRVVSINPEKLAVPFDAGDLPMSDVLVSADVTIAKGGGVVGLQCRSSADTDSDFQWYDFVARDGYAAIRLSDSQSNIDVLADTKKVSLPLGTQFTIAAGCVTKGDDVQLTLAIDDKPLLGATVPAKLTDGVPGLVGWTYPLHEQLDVIWDDFTVSRVAD